MIELALVILALVFLIYWPSLTGEPVGDDMTAIFSNETIIKGQWREQFQNWRWSPRTLTRVSWAFCATGPGRKLSYFVSFLHLGNVLFHWAAALLTIPIASAIGADPVLVALLFAVHPFAVSAVANMSHRAAVLATVFLLAALDAALLFHWLLALPFLFCALLSKEDAFWPVSLVLAKSRKGQVRLEVVDDGQRAAGLGGSLTWPCYIPTVLVENLRRFPLWLLGFGQSVEHHPTVRRYASLTFALTLLLTTSILVLLLIWGRPVNRAAVLLALLSPLPLYCFVKVKDTVVEGRLYFLTLPIALVLSQWPFFPTALVAGFAIAAVRRTFFYQDQIQFWRSAIGKNPSYRTMLNMGAALASHGDPVGALQWYEKILRLKPDHCLALLNLGLILEDEANRYYARSCGHLAETGRRGPDFDQFKHYRKLAHDRINRAHELCPKDSIVSMHCERIQQDKRA